MKLVKSFVFGNVILLSLIATISSCSKSGSSDLPSISTSSPSPVYNTVAITGICS